MDKPPHFFTGLDLATGRLDVAAQLVAAQLVEAKVTAKLLAALGRRELRHDIGETVIDLAEFVRLQIEADARSLERSRLHVDATIADYQDTARQAARDRAALAMARVDAGKRERDSEPDADLLAGVEAAVAKIRAHLHSPSPEMTSALNTIMDAALRCGPWKV